MMPFRSSRPTRSWLLTSTICLLLLAVPGLAAAAQTGPAAGSRGAADAAGDRKAADDDTGAAVPGVPVDARALLNVPGFRQASQDAADEDMARPWSAGLRGIGVFPGDESLDNGFGFGGFAVYRISTDLEIEIDASWIRSSSSPDGLGDGDLTLIPVRGTARVQLWRFRGAQPYAGGGAGIYLADFSLDDSVVSQFDELGFTVEQDVETGVGVHAVAGVEWTRDRYRFGVDARYVVGSLDGSSRVLDQVSNQLFTESNDIDLNGFWISFGVRIRL